MKEVRLTEKKKEALAQLGIEKSSDVLEYFPYRYETIEDAPYSSWEINSKVVVEGIVTSKPSIYRFGRNKSVINFVITTEDNTFKVAVFNQIWYLKQEVGKRIVVIGKYEGNGKILATSIINDSLENVLGIKPVYSLKDKVKPKYFSQLIAKVLEENRDEIHSFIPMSLREENHLLSRYAALKDIHFPRSSSSLQKAIKTMKYEEFFKFQCFMSYRKQINRLFDDRYAKKIDEKKLNEMIGDLPFSLTNDQQNVVNEIVNDLKSNYQMGRLLQGDVGSGKTIVSFIAMYATYLAGQQACLMAPTEILAKQHFNNIQRVFNGYNLRIELLYSGVPNIQRKQILQDIKNGHIDFVVGTHALFQQDVEFHNLGLIITDEQHRFGVKQRQLLQDKGNNPDILLMSATPIPRTLATSLYGDMDVSTISETPNKGKVIHTKLLKKNSFIPVIDEIEKLLDEGNQMYVVCATIEKSTEVLARNVNDIYNNLNDYFKGKYKLGLLHGQMDEEQKDAVQSAFSNHEIDILVTTTVVEVGVDVKNANIMVIYDANRFGLSQLHQLRGRIGRGSKEGYCYLLTNSVEEDAIERLNIIVENNDGFEISYRDLQLRGPGDILGYRQSGLPTFRLGNVVEDNELLQKTRLDALKILKDLDNPENTRVKEYLQEIQENAHYYLD